MEIFRKHSPVATASPASTLSYRPSELNSVWSHRHFHVESFQTERSLGAVSKGSNFRIILWCL